MGEIMKINSNDLEAVFQDESWHVIDVREPFELEDGWIEGSENHPFSTFSMNGLEPQDGHKWVIQCLKGGRATKIAEYLVANDFPGTVYVLTGGIEAWKAEKKPILMDHS